MDEKVVPIGVFYIESIILHSTIIIPWLFLPFFNQRKLLSRSVESAIVSFEKDLRNLHPMTVSLITSASRAWSVNGPGHRRIINQSCQMED